MFIVEDYGFPRPHVNWLYTLPDDAGFLSVIILFIEPLKDKGLYVVKFKTNYVHCCFIGEVKWLAAVMFTLKKYTDNPLFITDLVTI